MAELLLCCLNKDQQSFSHTNCLRAPVISHSEEKLLFAAAEDEQDLMKSQGVRELSCFVFLCVQEKIFIGSGRTFATRRFN